MVGAYGLTFLPLALLVLLVAAVYGDDYYNAGDNLCKITETRVTNCTRDVWYPCPDQSDGNDTSGSEDDDSVYGRRRRRSPDEFDALEDLLSTFFNLRWQNSNSRWCKKQKTFTCVQFRCYVGCCPGWQLDPQTQTCSIPTNETTPDITCENGGEAHVDEEGVARCQCPDFYTGERCEQVKCRRECLNEGMCDMVRGRPACVCPSGFSGPRCQRPICQGGCGSQGVCIAREGQATCVCSTGYTGQNCETRIPEKEGECPPVSPTTVGTCIVSCSDDSQCGGQQKCCSNGCGQRCTDPATYTCPHDNIDYEIGQTFRPDPCHVCTCLTPDPSKPFGGALCRNHTCPPLENCANVVRRDGECCPRCADEVTPEPVPDNYKLPRFLNCPSSGLVTLDVAEGSNQARLPVRLVARDYQDNDLKVTVSKTVFNAGVGVQNFDTVTATSSRDSRGEVAYCNFNIRIRDLHPPVFTYCPVDILLDTEGRANWTLPEARDNVGLVRPPFSRSKPGDHFRKGEHPISYLTEDYEGNMATCQFFVKVAHTDMSRSDRPLPMGEPLPHKMMFVIGGVIAFLLIVVAAVIVVLFCCCRRRRRRGEDATLPPPSYENTVYNLGHDLPPPYKEKPHVYDNAQPEVLEHDIEAGSEKKDGLPDDDETPLDAESVDVTVGVDNPGYRM